MTPEQMQSDIDFLARRQQRAGSVSFSRGRETGISSNSLVSLAYGVGELEMPSDWGDYAACARAFKRMPRHRRTSEILAALSEQKAAVEKKYPASERRRKNADLRKAA